MTWTDRSESGQPDRLGLASRFLLPWIAALFFAVVAIWPVLLRLRHPTILGDDVTRLVDLIEMPFREHLFLPFGEHIAPFFQLISWLSWQAIGQDLRLAPLAYCMAAGFSWLLVLGLLGCWLARETGSPTASCASVAMVAQSPLVLEAVWWYSASSFLWAIAGVLAAVLGASWVGRRPVRGLLLVVIGTAIGPAGTTLGLLAAPLAILRGLIEPRVSSWVKAMVVVAALGGLLAYEQFCKLGRIEVIHARVQDLGKLELLAGMGYALSVPGRLLWPAAVGVPASWAAAPLPAWIGWGAGILAILGTTALLVWPRSRWDRRLVLVGAAMIYLTYALIYPSRVSMLKMGRWTEKQLLYEYAGRYHVLPLLGVTAIVAAILAARPLIRRCDTRRGLAAIAGALAGLMMLAIQHGEARRWHWMLGQPGQKKTLAVLHHLGKLARDEGITRAQLLRIIDPAYRSWNQSLLLDCPAAFPLMKLVVHAPGRVARPLTDQEARDRLKARLTETERLAIGAEACVSLNPAQLEPGARTLAVARRVAIDHARELEPGRYRSERLPAGIRFEFDQVADARYLVLPGLSADQDVVVVWCDDEGRWRSGQSVRWLQSPPGGSPAVIDLERLIHLRQGPLPRIAIHFTRPGEIALAGPPRLLR